MKRIFFFALVALAFVSINMERRAPASHAVFAQQERKGEAKASAVAVDASPVVVRELDLEGLKKLLQRDGTKSPARPRLINFWATWCVPCREEFPDLLHIEADYSKRGLEMIFISMDDPADIKTVVPEFLREMKAEKIPTYLLNVPDPIPAIEAVDAKWEGAIALPITFLFDAQGKLVFKTTGRVKPAELRPLLDSITKN
ncbi:MAG: TlpA family protein disulfide reductase [Pyrinomonadaceae bacterium]|nr:TlpA family protein disulfide reductase [Pyrinomonadaceae bacterium]